MKVNIEIDCTPVEARQFFGLPDLGPLQAAVLERLEKEMLAEMDRLSPEAIMRTDLAAWVVSAKPRTASLSSMARSTRIASENSSILVARAFVLVRPKM